MTSFASNNNNENLAVDFVIISWLNQLTSCGRHWKHYNMTEYLESFINIVYDIKSSWSGENITSLDLIGRVLSNSTLLNAVANRTSLSAEYINNTIISVVGNAKEIAELYQALSNGNNNDRLQVEPLNTT